VKTSGITDMHLLRSRGWQQTRDSKSLMTSAVTNTNLEPNRIMFCGNVYRKHAYHLCTTMIESVTCQDCKDAYAMDMLAEVP
jgi:hypothetical protein